MSDTVQGIDLVSLAEETMLQRLHTMVACDYVLLSRNPKTRKWQVQYKLRHEKPVRTIATVVALNAAATALETELKIQLSEAKEAT